MSQEVVGLIPAGGQGSRLGQLPCSKEMYPVGWHPTSSGAFFPKVASQYLLERMQLAEVSKVFFIVREGKWDIPAYFKDGSALGLQIAYLIMRLPYGVPYTLDQAFSFIQNATVVFGFPDIIFHPSDAFTRLLAKQAETKADIVLGLFPTNRPEKSDMVELDDVGRVRQIVIKPAQTHLRWTWIIAVWTPVFTRFMHKYLFERVSALPPEVLAVGAELQLGALIQAAIRTGLKAETVTFPTGHFLDIGTPDDLQRALQDSTPVV